MKKSRQIKIISMIALVVAIAGMTLGFAAFSKVLTITSSAQVTPNEEDFNIVTYGYKDENSIFNLREFHDEYLSNEVAAGECNNGEATGTIATITNTTKSSTISNINVTLKKEGDVYMYYFYIKNEGKYDAYINLEQYEYNSMMIFDKNGTCTAVESTVQDEIDTACQNIKLDLIAYDSYGQYIEGTEEEPYYKLSTGDHIFIEFYIYAGDNSIIDEPYTVDFEDITFNFSTAP